MIRPAACTEMAEVCAHRQGSANNRMFVLRCKTCNEMCRGAGPARGECRGAGVFEFLKLESRRHQHT